MTPYIAIIFHSAGQIVEEVFAATIGQAEEHIKEKVLEEYKDLEISRAVLAQYPKELPVIHWQQQQERLKAAEGKQTLQEQELAELDRLKAKYDIPNLKGLKKR